jgi:hypothetical protein
MKIITQYEWIILEWNWRNKSIISKTRKTISEYKRNQKNMKKERCNLRSVIKKKSCKWAGV